ncbi:hypothetical protein [Novipirellula rosea]|uniref:Uncharacterized protein n=1 Tax=Novipirellula rosea TaxID=1031540 RepID=A0ABP8N0Z9_9BACT|tara:strand:+ start:25948 stop:26166 length:219 start_codon:yes stop_codon:yes gene_type:complete
MQQFRVLAGVRVEVRKQEGIQWRGFTTTKETRLDEPIRRSRTSVVFVSAEWLLRVKTHDVQIYNGLRWVQMK